MTSEGGPAGRGGRAKSIGLGDALAAYVVDHGTPPDDVQRALIAETRRVAGRAAGMQVSPDQGALLTLLVRLVGARRVVEVGTFTGYSALCLARGLPADGRLLCCDINDTWVSVGRPFWERAGVADRIEVQARPRRRDPRRPADPTRSSTWPSSTPTRPATPPTTSCCCPACDPAA